MLTVLQPPLPPAGVGHECDHCNDNYVNQGFVLDHEKPPCDHADVGGYGGGFLKPVRWLPPELFYAFSSVVFAVTRPKTDRPSGEIASKIMFPVSS